MKNTTKAIDAKPSYVIDRSTRCVIRYFFKQFLLIQRSFFSCQKVFHSLPKMKMKMNGRLVNIRWPYMLELFDSETNNETSQHSIQVWHPAFVFLLKVVAWNEGLFSFVITQENKFHVPPKLKVNKSGWFHSCQGPVYSLRIKLKRNQQWPEMAEEVCEHCMFQDLQDN